MEAIAYAMPIFLLFMGIEYYFSNRKGKFFYSYQDTVTNISLAVLDRVTSLLFAGFFYFIYDILQKSFGVIEILNKWYNWAILFILVDFLWYWYHRFSHEVNIFWTVHVVHHQSKEFNFSVGTRITVFQQFVRLLFWGTLPLIGYPAYMLVPVILLHGTYSFFIHTRFIKNLGFLEYILVTPSNHRVHHASNEEYLDKNYGGVFIFWDILFGTYAKENAPIVYGLTKPLESKSLMWQIFHFYVELFYSVIHTKGVVNKLKMLFGKPDLVDPKLREKLEPVFLSRSYDKKLSAAFRNYIVIQLVVSVTIMILMLYFYSHLNATTLVITAFLISITLVNCGAILEQKRWVFYLEYARFILFLSSILLFTGKLLITATAVAVTLIVVMTSIFWFDRLKKYYYLKMSS